MSVMRQYIHGLSLVNLPLTKSISIMVTEEVNNDFNDLLFQIDIYHFTFMIFSLHITYKTSITNSPILQIKILRFFRV